MLKFGSRMNKTLRCDMGKAKQSKKAKSKSKVKKS
jgi:hypothetical protein